MYVGLFRPPASRVRRLDTRGIFFCPYPMECSTVWVFSRQLWPRFLLLRGSDFRIAARSPRKRGLESQVLDGRAGDARNISTSHVRPWTCKSGELPPTWLRSCYSGCPAVSPLRPKRRIAGFGSGRTWTVGKLSVDARDTSHRTRSGIDVMCQNAGVAILLSAALRDTPLSTQLPSPQSLLGKGVLNR